MLFSSRVMVTVMVRTIGLDLVCDRLVVMYTYLYYFPLSLSHCHLLVGSFVIDAINVVS